MATGSNVTPAQAAAIAQTGNVLVMAGAGAGKTSTLVRRCLARVTDTAHPASVDRILMVTFTEAAAAEMRRRIRAALDTEAMVQRRKIAEEAGDPGALERLTEQVALLETAPICTLHSFCLRLVREHFYELELDPQLSILDEAGSHLMAAEVLDELLKRHYAGKTPADLSVQELIVVHGRGWDQPIRDLVLRLHTYTQSLADPEHWYADQRAMFESAEPDAWRRWLWEGLEQWRQQWVEALRLHPEENNVAAKCANLLADAAPNPQPDGWADLLAQIADFKDDKHWPKGTKGKYRDPIISLFSEAEFFLSAARNPGPDGPLSEDWSWVRKQMLALLNLSEAFARDYSGSKRDAGMLDFHDLEQFTLRLLWDRMAGQPTALARHWQEKLDLLFVDEYQDINAAQDRIITALSRDGGRANRFLVGDVKQSIYRFRLADPRIFQQYAEVWKQPGAGGKVIPLSDNFRSHEAILNFINPLFGALMRRELGGVAYDEDAHIRFGAPSARAQFSVNADPSPRAELHLRLSQRGSEAVGPVEDEDASGLTDLSAAEQEAAMVGERLKALREGACDVWDEHSGTHRPVQWRDMVILLRSPRNKAEIYAKVFSRLGIPLSAARSGFFETTEISDLISLLTLLDNPLQDVPTLAVLHSPLVGMTPAELASIRLFQRRGHFWTALLRWHRECPPGKPGHLPPEAVAASESAWPKADAFLKSYRHWREIARKGALSHCLESILDQTHYEAWLRAQPRGEQRRANVQRLLGMTRQFDPLQRQGLFRFLKFINAQQEAGFDPEPAAAPAQDSVQLMSIHKSKGLEFPVVVLADLGGRFNYSESREGIVLDERYGLCPLIKPPVTEQRYPSLPFWLARQRQKREALGEELRLLYVAMTRAKDRLILAGTVSRSKLEKRWAEPRELTLPALSGAGSYLDWLGDWLSSGAETAAWTSTESGVGAGLAWRFHDAVTTSVATPSGEPETPATGPGILEDPSELRRVCERLEWHYPFDAATTEPAKTSVTGLRGRLKEDEDDEAQPATFAARPKTLRISGGADKPSAADIGTLHHRFLQRVRLEQTTSEQALRDDAARLVTEQALAETELAQLDFASLARFWNSETGRQIRDRAPHVQRELAFTARFTPSELAEHPSGATGDNLTGEFIVVQGVVDLAVLLPEEIWLMDFKTDALSDGDWEKKTLFYSPQLRLYAAALARIHGRPVTRQWLHYLALNRTIALEPETVNA